jgi:DNA-binding NarL/FixJ family response regulator
MDEEIAKDLQISGRTVQRYKQSLEKSINIIRYRKVLQNRKTEEMKNYKINR